MKARLPKNFQSTSQRDLLRQAQQMQEMMAAKQEQLKERLFNADAGGGMVSATVSGAKQLVALSIKPEIVDPDDVDMLCDIVVAAVNEALRTAEETTSAEMEQITASLNLPGMPGMF
jgi:DNA-binding YbaB/EbfC family protein